LGTGVEADVLADRVTSYFSDGLTGANIADQMVNSTAFKAMNYTNEAYVSTIYQAFFNRPATEQEIAAGKSLLDNWITRYYVLTTVVNAQEFKNYCISAVSAKPIPVTATGLKAISTSPSSIKISWNAVTGATGYALYRSTSATGGYVYIKSVTTTSYTNNGLTTGTTYYYKIKTYVMVGTTKISSVTGDAASASPIAAPAAPTGLAVVSAGPDSIQISWNPVAGVSGYSIYRSTSATSGFAYIKAVTSPGYTNTGLTTGTTYYYKIKAYTLVGSTKTYSAETEVVGVAP